MFKTKKLYTWLVAALLIGAAMALVACGKGGASGPYKVTVKDVLGNPCSNGVVVLFMQGDTQVAMQVCDKNGVATKELEPGDYTVQIKFTNADAEYYYEAGTLTAKNREIEINLMNCIEESQFTEIYPAGEPYTAYHIEEGVTYTELNTGERNYYIFTPVREGLYEIYVETEGNVQIGYYGAPHFVQENSVVEPENGVITVSISKGMIGTGDTGTTRLVLGVDVADGSTSNAKIVVKRVGDPEWTLEDEEWTVYQTTSDLELYVPDANTEIKEFDITADGYDIVFNEEDGFYHVGTSDGPLVVVFLAEDPFVPYVPCFMNILDKTGVDKYFFEEDGTFIKKETYSDCLYQYIDVADDEFGVYPMTEDLYYILHQMDEWWDKESPDFIFKDMNGNPVEGLNTEIAWLFMCGYIE